MIAEKEEGKWSKRRVEAALLPAVSSRKKGREKREEKRKEGSSGG